MSDTADDLATLPNPDAHGLKVPPHSLEAEQAVIGGLMLDNQAFDDVAEIVAEVDFYRREHKLIFRAIAQLGEENHPFDVITLGEALNKAGVLDEAGGMVYLAEVARNTPSASNIRAYAEIVRERSVLRQMIKVANEIAENAFSPKGRSASDLLDEAERKVFAIAEQGQKTGGPRDIKSVLKETVDRIDKLFSSDEAITGITTGFTDLDGMTSGLQPSDLVIVAARPSMGKCIVAGSRILDPETGERVPIEDIVQRQDGHLLTLREDFRLHATQPSAYVDDGLKPVYRVVTALGREIETTLSHPFLTGGGWKPLSQITVGERIGVPRCLPVFGQEEMPDHEVKLLAYFIADGGTTQACPQFTNGNVRLRDDFSQAVSLFGGVVCKTVESIDRTPSLRVSADPESNADNRAEFARKLKGLMQQKFLTGRDVAGMVDVAPSAVSYWLQAKNLPTHEVFARLASVLEVDERELLAQGRIGAGTNDPNRLSLWLEQHGLRYKLAPVKTVPPAVFRLCKPSLALFLNRLFACDGSVFVQNEDQAMVSYATSSLLLAKDVQHLLLRFGVLAKLRHKAIRYKDAMRSAYELVVSHQESLRIFLEDIGIFGKEEKLQQALELLRTKRTHSNTDSLPESVCDYVLALKDQRSWESIFAQQGEQCEPGYNPHLSGKSRRLLSRRRALEFARLFSDDYLSRLAQSDVYWDEIRTIEYQGHKQVYDLTVPDTHNFIAEDVLVHNTTFAMNLAENALIRTGKPVLVFSMEMPAESIVMRMLSSLGRIDQTRIRSGKLEEDDWPRFNSAISMLAEQKLFIDDSAGLSPVELRARARRVVRDNGPLAMIMVDYLQLMRVPGAESRVNEISEISRSLKALAKEMNCPVVALSQLNRSLEQRPNKRPVNSDLRESGAIEQDADIIMFIYRDEVYNEDSEEKGIAEIIIGKQRNGPIGTIRLAFQGRFTRFDDLAHDAYRGNSYE